MVTEHRCKNCNLIVGVTSNSEELPPTDFERYTKDLEDMLRRFIEWYPYVRPSPLVDEAKALLERTGYHCDPTPDPSGEGPTHRLCNEATCDCPCHRTG